ncbi:MAG: IS110 family transposase [Oscillospiraceae bacterium]|nr:IS110 family transposase [Oscillospiraceae bacterium]
MIAVGIDVSKSKSTVAILDSYGTVLATPFNMAHTQPEMNALVSRLKAFDEPVTILLEYTGHYHYPVLKKLQDEGFPVCVVNPYQMKKYGDVEIHKAKTDKKDALRIATYALEKSYKLVPYSFMEQKYEDLKFLSRQYDQRIAFVAKLKVQLINLLDQTMPGITKILALKSRNPEKSALMLFIKRYKSFDEIQRMGKTRFLSTYATLMKKTTDRHAPQKGLAIYELARDSITTRGEDPYIWSSQDQCVDLLATAQNAADEIITQMQNIAETIPEYKVLRAMNGVGDRLGPVILAEIGDIRRFHSAKALNSFAGNDAPPYQSGQFESRNRHISKRGSSALRKACFEVVQALKLTKPQDDPVYQFILKKEQEGKPYNVAKMAGVNKFLRIYYARAMELYR